ncbi:MAG TPA: hypothetical protein VGI39_08475, partial [Polyangiaceae bacterium]
MRLRRFSPVALLIFAACAAAPDRARAPAPAPLASAAPATPTTPPSAPASPWASLYPASRTVDAKDTLFGTEVRDPYRWL